MYEKIRGIIHQKPSVYFDYSQYVFLRGVDKLELLENSILEPIKRQIDDGLVVINPIKIGKYKHFFLTKKLKWDSEYFGFPCFSLEMIVSEIVDIQSMNEAINVYINEFVIDNAYVTVNLPSSHIQIIQAICSTKFRLIETRLNYYLIIKDNIKYSNKPIRKATNNDILSLSAVAKKMRNKFDRVHADCAFSEIEADNYLGTFAEQAVKGFADIVLVPDLVNRTPFAFLAGNLPISVFGKKVSKLVLAAVDSSIQKGWLYPLLLELIRNVQEEGADFLTTITQAANKPAIRVWEKAGFRLSNITHLYSFKRYDKIS